MDTTKEQEKKYEEELIGQSEKYLPDKDIEGRTSAELDFAREYNMECNRMLGRERKNRKIPQEKLAQGILSRAALEDLEQGRIGWTKLIGDTLMHRMGVDTGYYETVTSAENLDKWRLREDVCLLVPGSPAEAESKMREYRRKYPKRDNVEEQFLMKAEIILRLADIRKRRKINPAEAEEVLEMCRKAAACTIPEGWERKLLNFWLAPAELEAVLLTGAALAVCGRREEAWALQGSVWEYPKEKKWEERMLVRIIPQAALLGMELALAESNMEAAFEMGKEALELLRRNGSHCYLMPLLDLFDRIKLGNEREALSRRSLQAEGSPGGKHDRNAQAEGSPNMKSGRQAEVEEYLAKAQGFRSTFRQIYETAGCSGYRLWQDMDADNTREAGMVLKMLRMFEGKARAKAIYDEEGQIITEGQLVKIEKGIHKPSYQNYQRLMKQYGRYGWWGMPIVETDSAEVLELRQRISTLIGFGRWEEAEQEMQWFRRKVDAGYPRVKQELLFWEALLKWKKENELEECLAMMLKALHYTVPDAKGRKMEYWVFQREEIIIASNIGMLYRKLGKLDKAKEWFETVLHSLEKTKDRTGIMYVGYGILMGGYDNLLADMGYIEKALEMDKEAIQAYLKWPQIWCLASMFYRIAWNSYEIASPDTETVTERNKNCCLKWREPFLISESLADFMYDERYLAFLGDSARREKFLFHYT